jgi:hypothetical protein
LLVLEKSFCTKFAKKKIAMQKLKTNQN